MPRRPARPVSFLYSPGASISWRSPWVFTSSSMTPYLPRELPGPRMRAVPDVRAELVLVQRDDVRVGDRMAVDLRVHRVELVADQVMLLERHRALLLDHDPGGAAERADPLAELLRVADR